MLAKKEHERMNVTKFSYGPSSTMLNAIHAHNIQNIQNVQHVQNVQNVQSVQSVQSMQNVPAFQQSPFILNSCVNGNFQNCPIIVPVSKWVVLTSPVSHNQFDCEAKLIFHTSFSQFDSSVSCSSTESS